MILFGVYFEFYLMCVNICFVVEIKKKEGNKMFLVWLVIMKEYEFCD